jgi:hypothetical protein
MITAGYDPVLVVAAIAAATRGIGVIDAADTDRTIRWWYRLRNGDRPGTPPGGPSDVVRADSRVDTNSAVGQPDSDEDRP